MDVFTMVINVACSLVVGSVLAVLPISREVVASDLEFLAGRPVPIPGIRPFLLLLRDLVTRDASVEDVASWRETLTPAFARRLTEVNISICEMRSELRCTTREARAPTYEVQLD